MAGASRQTLSLSHNSRCLCQGLEQPSGGAEGMRFEQMKLMMEGYRMTGEAKIPGALAYLTELLQVWFN